MFGICGPHTVSSLPGVQGWHQFLPEKRQMLAEFDGARTQGKIHEVQAWHGKVAEGLFRKWLADFLPWRFHIRLYYSQNRFEQEKAPHFDIIIYDRLNAPVLWIEDHPEVTEAGKSRARFTRTRAGQQCDISWI